MPLVAQVAVSGATIHFDKLYSYLVPQGLAKRVHTGSMVLVPFGRGSKARMGVVLAAGEEPGPAARLKALYDAAPEEARLSPELLALVHALREGTFCTYYEAVKAIIPYGAQYRAVEMGGVPRLQKQLVRHTEWAYSRAEAPRKFTPKQSAAWQALAGGPLGQSALEAAGISRDVLERMEKKGMLAREKRDKELELYGQYGFDAAPQPVRLSAEQQRAYDALAPGLSQKKPQPALLYGVTGSGKTLVFLKLIEQCLSLGRQALVLVPEISLTPQMIRRLKAQFGRRVAVQHSALNHTERLLQWQQIQNGGADVVVGTRSAVFSPLERLGLIVIDEEQEHTYHSENSPRYDAREVARRRAAAHGALLVLASATPSVESFYAARAGRMQLVQLLHRYNDMPLPKVYMADMRAELAAGNASALSGFLEQQLRENLASHGQSILLLNRRGYQTVAMCTSCGEVLKCTSCSVPMVYHKAAGKLLCHYCGAAHSPVPQACPACGGKLKYTGFGTQRIEEQLAGLLPEARVLRMDTDSTAHKNAHETLLRAFANGEYDILLGTQMVAKGLDFERVTLVGVLGIDQMLFAQGYRAFENVFSLVTQVVGRAGRARQPGRAVIQTVDPQHPVLALAANQDYASFYEQEISFRRLNLYPPFCTICMAGFSGKNEAAVLQAARAFAAFVQAETQRRGGVPLRLLGPAPMSVAMVKQQYRYKLTLKCRGDKAFRAMLRAALEQYDAGGWASKASVTIDFHADADL
ncbi:MAG: primosomal protein N' [Oscillospiraceae bacterium]|nr:primosomal protein N' [Oscillospiraceae bacterium]